MTEKKTKKARRLRPAKCPECKSSKALKIVYGMPAAPKPGERFHYAGCDPVIGGPTWHCEACSHEW